MNLNSYGLPPEVTLTREIYNAAQTPEIQALLAMPIGPEREAQALQLAAEGSLIDNVIHVWGWDPAVTMYLRSQYGMTWVPNALQQNIYVVPLPGLPAYDPAKPPAGSIKVSFKAEDFPPFGGPKPPAPKPSYIGNPLGFVIAGKPVYSAAAQLAFTEGHTEVTADGVFVFHLLGTSLMEPQTRTGVWLKQSS